MIFFFTDIEDITVVHKDINFIIKSCKKISHEQEQLTNERFSAGEVEIHIFQYLCSVLFKINYYYELK